MPISLTDHAKFTFTSVNLDPSTFEIVNFAGEEAVSALPRFEIELVSEDSDVDLSLVVNDRASLVLHYGTQDVPFHGIVADVQQTGRAGKWFGYRAVLVPRLWLLGLNYQSRIFHNEPVETIVKTVLTDAGLRTEVDFQIDLQADYVPREYCVQYNESDLNFLSRLLEFEGIRYFFNYEDAEEGKDVLMIADTPGLHEAVAGNDLLEFNDGGGLEGPNEFVREFTWREQVVTGSFMVRDYFYGEPEKFVSAESQLNTKMPGRRYEYGGRLLDQSSGKRIALVRNEESESTRRVFNGESDCRRIVSGKTFSLEKHFRSSLNAKYLITSVRHEGAQALALPGLSLPEDHPEETTYRNHFTCIPADAPYRPRRVTPIPRISGILAAKVESAGGEYAYVDAQGRYKVKMPFDLSDRSNGTASLPVPQAQINGGPKVGVHFPVHKNNDVLIAFEDGDVDRPYAVGCLPNPTNQSPVTEANRPQNVIRTMGGNEMVMDDTKDNAQIWIQTPDAHKLTFDDKEDRVILTTTKKHQVSFDDKNQKIEVKTKNGHFILMDDANEKLTIQSKDGHRISINDMDKLITMVDESGDHVIQIDAGNKQLTMKTATGGIDLQAPAGLVEIKAKELKVETSGDSSFKAANINAEAQSDFKIKGNNVTAEAAMDYKQKGMNVTSEASLAHKIKGAQVKSEGAATNDVQGLAVSVKATAINTIQGMPVKIN